MFSFWLCICWLPISLHAQNFQASFIPEQFLPENTLAICVLPDPPATLQRFKQTLLYEAWLAGATAQPVEIPADTSGIKTAPLFENVLQKFPALMQGKLFSDIRPLFDKSVAVALVDIMPGEDAGASLFSPELVFIADVSDSAEMVKNVLETKIIKAIQSKEPDVEFMVESFAGIDSYVLSNDQFHIQYAFIDHAFILALSGETLHKIIAVSQAARNRTAEDAASTLFNAASYRAVFDTAIQGDHESRIYVNVQRLWRTLRPLIYQQCADSQSVRNRILLELLDHYQLTTLAWTFSLKDGGGYERLFYKIDSQEDPQNSRSASPRLLPVLAEAGNGAFSSDEIIPANILYYWAIRGNIAKLWRQLTDSIQMSPFPQQQEQFRTWVENIEHGLHTSLEQEFLPALGQEMAVAWYDMGFRHRLTRSQAVLEDFPLVLLVQVAKRQTLDQILPRLLTFSQARNKNRIFRGTEIRVFEIPGAIAPVTVYMAFVRDFLVLSVSRTVLEAIIATSQQGGELASNQDYRKLSVSFPDLIYAKGYINLKRVLRRMQQKPSIKVPDISSFAERFSGMMWVTTVVNGGFLTESFSTIGGPVVGAAFVTTLASF